MKRIQLLKPELKSVTEALQAFEWPRRSGTGLDSEQTETASNTFQWDALEVVSCDRSLPKPVCFVWEAVRERSKNIVYDLFISIDPAFEDSIVLEDIAEPCHCVMNLRIGTQYFWKVVARESDSVLAESEVWVFTTNPATPRWLNVPGITNVRDMGGWSLPGNRRIRQGLIYRSSEMNGHVDITDEGKRILIEDLSVRTDLDLRRSNENPRAVLDEKLVTWINLPIGPYQSIVADDSRENYRQIFKVFSDRSTYPILFHCWGGCDRGGTLAFLLNALLGLDRDALIHDYELSSLSIWGERSLVSDVYEFQPFLNVLQSFGAETDGVGTLVENYLLSIGVTAEEMAAIRDQLTEERGKSLVASC